MKPISLAVWALTCGVAAAATTLEDEVEALRRENQELRAALARATSPSASPRRRLRFGYADAPAYEEQMCTEDEVYAYRHADMVEQYALYRYNTTTLEEDKSLAFYETYSSGLAWIDSWEEYFNPMTFNMETVDSLTFVKHMQGDVFQLPNTSNSPSDVDFDLPTVVNYTEPSDLIYMPILDMAALIKNLTVSCVTVVQTFLDRLTEFEPYLAIVSTLREEEALATAAEYDAMLAAGEYISPLMCIPFGMKDHHQIEDEPTRDGNILYAAQVLPNKSTLVHNFIDAGAIPIAKLHMGSWASGPVHGWGICMSPYLSGHGSGSSCGSGSAAALGAVKFALSEETWGSIQSPADASHISGHITSYGVYSRGGATMLSPTMDHLGFHTRWLKDFGLLVNYGRGEMADPLDADTTPFEFVDPAKVDKTSMRVLIVTGDGQPVYDNETGTWGWNEAVPLDGKNGRYWKERTDLAAAALDAAGIPYDTVDFSESAALWDVLNDEFFTSFPLDDDGSNQISAIWVGMYSGTVRAKVEQFFLGRENTVRRIIRWGGRVLPHRLYRNIAWAYIHMGKLLFNDPLWKTYDVVITTDSYAVTQFHYSAIEEWLRTAKTFVVDHYQATPCLHPTNATIEGAMMTLTALPFNDHLNFVVGTAIQEYEPIKAKIMYPNEDAIKTAFEGRSRCAYEFYEEFGRKDSCPAPDEEGSPLYISGSYAQYNACDKESFLKHIPDAWAESEYVSAYLLDDPAPDEAILGFDRYKPVACTHVCPWVPELCDVKGITCDARRLEAEQEILASTPEGYLRSSYTPEEIAQIKKELEDLDNGRPMQ